MANDLGRQALIEALRANNPNLIPAGQYGSVDRVVAAKNLRIQLKATFPGVKFSVKSESYSGGSSINVYWVDGPALNDVELIVDQYQYGNFNGMEDIYENSKSLWPDAFGGAKYVFANRRNSDAAIAEALNELGYADRYSVDDYNSGRMNYAGNNCVAQAIREFIRGKNYGTVEQ